MRDSPDNLGALQSVHRPATIRLWLLSLFAAAFLVFVVLGLLLTVNSFFSQNKADTVASPLACLGVSLLCFVVMASLLIKDFQKWLATRTVKLSLYQAGFTYECAGRMETCRWDEIKDVTHSRIEVRSKHSTPRRISVIRSIVKNDGEMITLAETLNLQKITTIFATARQ